MQVAETHRVRDLAQMIADKTGTGIDYITNPRNEAAENELDVKNEKFGNLGVDFTSLDATLFEEVRELNLRSMPSTCTLAKMLVGGMSTLPREATCVFLRTYDTLYSPRSTSGHEKFTPPLHCSHIRFISRIGFEIPAGRRFLGFGRNTLRLPRSLNSQPRLRLLGIACSSSDVPIGLPGVCTSEVLPAAVGTRGCCGEG